MDFDLFLKRLETERSLEIVPMTRGQLVQLLTRVHVAEGMPVEQAKIYADVHVSVFIAELKRKG